MKIFFTSDLHLNHNNILKHADRPFTTIKEHDVEIIKRHNEVVGPNDVVYNLGDVLFGDKEDARYYFFQLNGQIKVLGYPWHHDKKWLPRYPGSTIVKFGLSEFYSKRGHKVEILPPMVVLEFKEFSTNKYPKAIVLCHYQLARWDRRHYGSWHLFGHSHGKVKGEGLSMDVGVDSWNFYPVPLYQIAKIMKGREKNGLD